MIHFFSYGTLKDHDVQLRLLGRIPEQKGFTLQDYAVYCSKDGYYSIKQKQGSETHGVLMRLHNYELNLLDLWEEVPQYIRVIVQEKVYGLELLCYQKTDQQRSDRLVVESETLCDDSKENLLKTLDEFLLVHMRQIESIRSRAKKNR